MLSPFEMDEDQILEGFLCPICRADLKTPECLTEHVEIVHAEDQDVLKSLKEMFSKAKRRIKLNFDETVDLARSFDSSLKLETNSVSEINVLNLMIQNVGVDCSHFSEFKAVRTPRLERYASETNKLIIRLHKLLKDRPSDPVQRKLHEQKIVPWLDGKLVKLCPSCAKSFSLTRRHHHCRLCGSIMCHECSKFLPLEDALTLVSAETSIEDEARKDKELNIFRTCEHCLHLLEGRKEMHDSRTYRPPIVQIYAEIQDLKKEIIPDIEMYSKIVKNLYEGDSIFTITDASALRGKIGRVAEVIDIKSKKILALPCIEGTREEALKRAVRLACVQFIKEEMLSIPQLPVEGEIKKLQEKRRRETEQKIERERRLALEAYEKYGLNEVNSFVSVKDNSTSKSAVTTIDNWSGHQSSATNINDPLVEQINIIKGYIKQAREAMRFDELATLEMNLRELQNEFYKLHQGH